MRRRRKRPGIGRTQRFKSWGFSKKIPYSTNTRGTNKKRSASTSFFVMVHPTGFEPVTPSSEDQCSNPLSYGCKIQNPPNLAVKYKWQARLESNQHCILRGDMSYPLNDRPVSLFQHTPLLNRNQECSYIYKQPQRKIPVTKATRTKLRVQRFFALCIRVKTPATMKIPKYDSFSATPRKSISPNQPSINAPSNTPKKSISFTPSLGSTRHPLKRMI